MADDRRLPGPMPASTPEAPERAGLGTQPVSLEAFLADIGARAFRFAELGLRHRDDALDAVQDAMTRMLAYRERPATEWTPLFWRVLRSRIVDAQRRRRFSLRWLAAPSAGSDIVDWEEAVPDAGLHDPLRHQHGREAWNRIASALRALPARQREAFTLRIFEELDVATTAHVMSCSEGAVKTHLSRARESLQQQLEDFR